MPAGSRLAIGTAQFGMNYGIANRHGQVSLNDAETILYEASEAGISTIDTAILYGTSEKILGNCTLDHWRIISKLPSIPAQVQNTAEWVQDQVEASLQRLNINSLNGLLMHKPSDLLSAHGRAIYSAVEALKKSGKIGAFGVSVYDPSEITDYWNDFVIDIVQVPFNILDRRLIRGEWLQKFESQGIEIHIRSVFLQGLLLMPQNEIPEKFARWKDLFALWHRWVSDHGTTPLTACLQFVKSFAQISRIVVGIDNLMQFRQLLEAWNSPFPGIPEAISSNDPLLIQPSNWDSL